MVHPGGVRALVTVALLLGGLGIAAAGADPGPKAAAEQPAASVRTCEDRVEGGVIRPRAPRDTVVGRIAWYRLHAAFDPDQQDRGRKYGYEVTPMKALAIVRAGRRVTVVVPESQRSWLWLDYRDSGSGWGTHRAVFFPCPRRRSAEEQREDCGWGPVDACRSGLTQFNGGIAIDYDAAPRSGRCARVIVRVRGEATRRALLFPRRCARSS
jgi:hypothetical protein